MQMEIIIVGLVCVGCIFLIYNKLSAQISDIGKAISKAPAANAPVAFAPAPVSSANTVNNGEEVAVAISAALGMHESQMMEAAAMAAVIAYIEDEQNCVVASTSPVIKAPRTRRRESVWVAAARTESHQKLY